MTKMPSTIDTTNIQGSIWPRLPKYYETFLFFKIKDEDEFKTHLRKLVNDKKITTGAECKEYLKENGGLSERQERVDTRPEDRRAFNAINISFTGKGVDKLVGPFKEYKLKDLLHERGMFQDLVYEGPDEPGNLSPEYQPPKGYPKNNDNWRADGLFIVAAQDEEGLGGTIKDLKKYFNIADDDAIDADDASARITLTKKGNVRNADNRAKKRFIPDEKDATKERIENLRGKEHFGFEDQISQPHIEGLDEPPAEGEPKAIPPGWILLGQEGDNTNSPKWANDGSFLVFREIEQNVSEFNNFMKEQSQHLTSFDNSGEKLAAHMMGRWKNGSPVELDEENSVAKHPFANNFDYGRKYSGAKDVKCPFAAHIRKMRPRADLYVGASDNANVSAASNTVNNSNVILRRSITFGPEITEDEESMEKEQKPKRGIYFLCYQADLRNGFNLLVTRWASNRVFASKKDFEHSPGVDPIVSQKNRPDHPDGEFSIFGGPDDPKPQLLNLGYLPWIDQRGGEYFFTPSLDALKTVFVDELPL